ncbi:MAG: rubredoxin [Fusobacteriaceae bacterium]
MSVERYKCTICSYVYDSEVGDVENKVVPGTKLEDLDPQWVCPLCNASKDHFEKWEA